VVYAVLKFEHYFCLRENKLMDLRVFITITKSLACAI
jgi:hypothetical protein